MLALIFHLIRSKTNWEKEKTEGDRQKKKPSNEYQNKSRKKRNEKNEILEHKCFNLNSRNNETIWSSVRFEQLSKEGKRKIIEVQ